jgi:hypothetical protein
MPVAAWIFWNASPSICTLSMDSTSSVLYLLRCLCSFVLEVVLEMRASSRFLSSCRPIDACVSTVNAVVPSCRSCCRNLQSLNAPNSEGILPKKSEILRHTLGLRYPQIVQTPEYLVAAGPSWGISNSTSVHICTSWPLSLAYALLLLCSLVYNVTHPRLGAGCLWVCCTIVHLECVSEPSASSAIGIPLWC